MSSPARRLRQRIEEQGPISFADFMADALYGEEGYYRREPLAIGVDGDFVTGSSHSDLFGRATARLVRRLDEALGRPADILEVGYGDGRHLGSLLQALGGIGRRRVVAVDRVRRPLADGVRVLTSLDELSPAGLTGLVFSYELFDALPVHRLIGTDDGGVAELGVDLDADGGFRYRQLRLSRPELTKVPGAGAGDLSPGQIADVSLEWGRLYARLAEVVDRGLLVTCDYGFERPRLYDRRVRRHGTLACYRQQRVHRDALRDPGQQDLTAHVDFTTLVETGEAAGLATLGLGRQARWLVSCGLFEELEGADQATRLEAMDLLSPAGMGEEIRVLVQAKDLDVDSVIDRQIFGGELGRGVGLASS